jgi:hypothetical protein
MGKKAIERERRKMNSHIKHWNAGILPVEFGIPISSSFWLIHSKEWEEWQK